jgi:hypothetical protein
LKINEEELAFGTLLDKLSTHLAIILVDSSRLQGKDTDRFVYLASLIPFKWYYSIVMVRFVGHFLLLVDYTLESDCITYLDSSVGPGAFVDGSCN